MAKYVDGYVIAMEEKNLPAYLKMAKEAGKLWKKHGALEYFECVGEDLNPDMGGEKILNFPKMIGSKKGEVVLFSFVVFKSRSHRDAVNAKVMKDPSMAKYENEPMPFKMSRMAYGGFKTIVSL